MTLSKSELLTKHQAPARAAVLPLRLLIRPSYKSHVKQLMYAPSWLYPKNVRYLTIDLGWPDYYLLLVREGAATRIQHYLRIAIMIKCAGEH